MIHIRRADERGRADFGWLDSRHTFSFGDYFDQRHMGFGDLRVINEDRVAPGGGFPTHGHRDMEIVSYVLDGGLEHKDSLGSGGVICPGDVQRMSAGTGVRHSEFNASRADPVHFLQIWILPRAGDLPPSYEQKHFAPEQLRGRLALVASPDGRDGSVTVQQDAAIFAALLDAGQSVAHPFARGRRGWLQVARGAVKLNGTPLAAGDGAALTDEGEARIEATAASELLLFDLR